MMVRARRPRRRFFAPEVIQTSAMDCGPASLKCVLEGFGVPVSYGHLRDACHTDVDGTSINTLERAAVQLGVDAKQIMVPVDHVLLPEANALPAIAVVRLPTGNTHFVILWRNHAGRVQVMDPATGRRWPSAARALGELYEHQHRVPASGWKKWTESVEFTGAVQRRMAGLGLRSDESARLIDYASRQPGWRPIAGLDAGVRMLDRLAARGDAASRGEPAVVLQRLVSKIVETGDEGAVPERYWSVRPGGPSGDGTSETVVLRGAVLVRMKGLLPASEARRTAQNVGGSAVPASDLTAALAAPSTSPLRHLLALLRPEAAVPVGVLLWAAVLAAGGVIVQAVLLRELLQAGEALVLPEQRLFGVILLIGLLVAFLALELPLVAGVVRFGRSLETRLRIRFLEKLPRLHDRYFQSRLASDLAQRAHTVHVLHQAPELVTRTIRIVMEIVCTLGVLAWLEADRWPTVLALGVGAIVVPLLLTSMIVERDLRVRTHTGALSRFYLDGLIGLFAVRAHAAERTLRREQAGLLAEWRIANDDLLGAAVAAETIQAVVAAAMAAWLVYTHVAANTDPSGLLMLVYWIMRLSTLSEELVQLGRQYPAHRNTTLRLLEPLGAAERGHSTDVSPVGREASSVSAPGPPHVRGVAIRMRDVSVRLSGRTILDKVSLDIPSGAHVAVVGASGAGKSTLAGVLLGWYSTSGGIEVDDIVWMKSPARRCGAKRPGSTHRCGCGTDRSTTTCATASTTGCVLWGSRSMRPTCGTSSRTRPRGCRRRSAKAGGWCPAVRANACAWRGRC